jgi:MFS family permease
MEGKGSPAKMFLAGFIANLPGLSAGLSMGFSAILIPQLQDPDAEITATLEQGSWIASLFVIGDLLGCVIGGPLADRFSHQYC